MRRAFLSWLGFSVWLLPWLPALAAGVGAVPAAATAATAVAPAAAELVLRGTQVVTMDAARPAATAVAVRDGEIVYVGDDAGAAPFIGPRTRLVQGAGMTVLPGLTDSHAHVIGLGLSLERIDLRGDSSTTTIAKKVQEAATKKSSGWLLGRGWDQNRFTPPELPGRAALALLDAASGNRPVLLRRIDGHAAWVNSEALRRAGISSGDCKDPPGGRIMRGPQCEPTGVLIDNAMSLVERLLPQSTPAEIEAAILKAAAYVTARGLTSVHDMGLDPDGIAAYRRLAQAGRLPLRVFAYHADPIPESLSQLPKSLSYRAELDRLRQRLGPPESNPMFSVRGIKLYMDGALGSRGAALQAPYSDEPQSSGLLLHPPEHIEQMARWAMLHGYQLATHAIGDRAVHLVLDAYERAGVKSAKNLRFRIEHVQVVLPSDLSRRRFRELGVIASVQPSHATSDMPWAGARLGPERLKFSYAYRSLLGSGARLAGGSDFPVEEADPRLILHAAVTRKDEQGNPPSGFLPAERLSLGEALRMVTSDAAYAAFTEDRLGRISVGKLADLTVIAGALNLNDSPAAAPPEDLLRREIIMTIIGGKVVHDKTKLPTAKPASPKH
jgi:predicted amidohydrolase YtcJ